VFFGKNTKRFLLLAIFFTNIWNINEDIHNEPCRVASRHVFLRALHDGHLLFIHGGMQENLMTALALCIAILLFIYLVVALIRPEKF
jgi:K+-transporting ATPase KdpF subunit